jgi:tetratricopeptide (TPR) repeat protein
VSEERSTKPATTKALENIENLPAGRERDRHEVAIRLERGFLASAATGQTSAEAVFEFERCLELIGNEPSLELSGALSALWNYFTARGRLDKATELVEALRALEGTSDWSTAAYNALAGALAMFRGQFHASRSALDAAAELLDRTGAPEMAEMWYAPNDPIAGMYAELGFIQFLQGDLAAAEPTFARIKDRCSTLRFPHNATTTCYTRAREASTRIEAGQLDLAAEIIDEIGSHAEKYGLGEWTMVSMSNRATLTARIALAAGEADPAVLQPHIDNLTLIVGSWRAAELNTFVASYESVLARLLTAIGDLQLARQRVELALETTRVTGAHFYDAELLRVRAHTYDDPGAQYAGLQRAIEVAREQGAVVFELRCAADAFELVGAPARPVLEEALSRIAADQDWPELARARALLG